MSLSLEGGVARQSGGGGGERGKIDEKQKRKQQKNNNKNSIGVFTFQFLKTFPPFMKSFMIVEQVPNFSSFPDHLGI